MSDKAKIDIKRLSRNGIRLTHQILYRYKTEIFESESNRFMIGAMLDAITGSKLSLSVVSLCGHDTYLQLHCGDVVCENLLTWGELATINKLLPFIIACTANATAADSTNPEPSSLEDLAQRVARIESQLGIKDE